MKRGDEETREKLKENKWRMISDRGWKKRMKHKIE